MLKRILVPLDGSKRAEQALPVHRVARYHDDDLLDIAATQTLLHSGSVYAVEQAKVPDGELVAAVFRY